MVDGKKERIVALRRVRCGATAISRTWLTEIRHYDIMRAVLKPHERKNVPDVRHRNDGEPHDRHVGCNCRRRVTPRSRPTGHPFFTDGMLLIVPCISHAPRRNGVISVNQEKFTQNTNSIIERANQVAFKKENKIVIFVALRISLIKIKYLCVNLRRC